MLSPHRAYAGRKVQLCGLLQPCFGGCAGSGSREPRVAPHKRRLTPTWLLSHLNADQGTGRGAAGTLDEKGLPRAPRIVAV